MRSYVGSVESWKKGPAVCGCVIFERRARTLEDDSACMNISKSRLTRTVSNLAQARQSRASSSQPGVNPKMRSYRSALICTVMPCWYQVKGRCARLIFKTAPY